MMAQRGENDAAWIAADEPLLVWPEVCGRLRWHGFSAGERFGQTDEGGLVLEHGKRALLIVASKHSPKVIRLHLARTVEPGSIATTLRRLSTSAPIRVGAAGHLCSPRTGRRS